MFCLYCSKKELILVIFLVNVLWHACPMNGEGVLQGTLLQVTNNQKPLAHNNDEVYNHFSHAQNILQATMTMFILNKFFYAIAHFIHTKRIKDNKSHTTLHIPAKVDNEDGYMVKDLDVPHMSGPEKKIFNQLINNIAQDICYSIHQCFVKSIDAILNTVPHVIGDAIVKNIKTSFDRVDQKKGKEQIAQLIKECVDILFTLNQYHIHVNFQSLYDSGGDTMALEIIEGVVDTLNDEVSKLKAEIKSDVHLTVDQVKYIKKYIFVHLFPH